MSTTDVDLRKKLAICGYLRNIISDENDYNFIILIIVSYYKQGIVTYFDGTIDKDYKHKMRFGDIVKTHRPEREGDFIYMVSDMNNKLIRVGEHCDYIYGEYIDVCFPFSICRYLDDAVSFYSKFHASCSLLNLDELTFSFIVKNDDQWIINHFNGPLNPEYTSIEIEFDDGKCQGVRICFVEFNKDKLIKRFCSKDDKFAVSCKDIDEFYQLRKSKQNLIKIRMSLKEDWSSFVKTQKSPAWYALRVRKVEQMLFLWKEDWSSFVKSDDIDFIGPKREKNKLINKLESLCNMSLNHAVSFIPLNKSDYIS